MNSQRKSDSTVKLAKRYHFDSIDSTNSWAKSHPQLWSVQGVTLVTADAQQKGRGRWNHRWISPPGVNMYASFCFWSHVRLEEIGWFCPLLACSAASLLEALGFAPLIKWPNDLLIRGEKIGGILCETFEGRKARGVVCGIGLNINMTDHFIDQIAKPATSLFLQSGKTFDVEAVTLALSAQFLKDLFLFLEQGFSPFFADWRERSMHKKGDPVRFYTSSGLLEGFFSQFMENGDLEVLLKEGGLKQFSSLEFFN